MPSTTASARSIPTRACSCSPATVSPASFKGKGTDAFSAWVTAHLKYPKDAKAAHIDGTVRVKFVIGTNGGVQEVEVEKGVFPSLDAEAVRVVKSSPKWKPGIKDGKPVRVSYTLPVIFVLPD